MHLPEQRAVKDREQDGDEEKEEERTSAVVIAEEGRGLIVRGDGIPVVQLQVHPGKFPFIIIKWPDGID